MKRKNLLLILAGLMAGFSALSQNVQLPLASTVAQNFISCQGKDVQLSQVEAFNDGSEQLAWIANLNPEGFILISATKKLRPVLAYSFECNWNIQNEEADIYLAILKGDLKMRLTFPENNPRKVAAIADEWDALISGTKSKILLEQWPPEGTTPTGGWLFTNWTQGSPYNRMCPIDGNTHQRSYAGCPATAMSQILNCLMDVKETSFDDADDYYHSFGSGNQYWIDDDWEEFNFPNFDLLNLYMDSITIKYAGHKPLSTDEAAALNFACGVALKQVFSSSVSGTWGIEQAGEAFQRFGFAESRLVYSSDTALAADLAENIKNGWPAQLGLVDPPPTTVGHNVVVDGYNTDDYFHFNFGWGGSSNGWYTMPPTSIPYNLTVIEGIVLDIIGENPHVGISKQNPVSIKNFELT
ncbi:MAG: C10 family peptidase, partial [Bacteroidales bacterium]|nr:C10 family peptidase [Bacteroidales bacterium]